ncbi:MAG: hypothetical protein ACM3MG_07180 [Bacillota bacterium]
MKTYSLVQNNKGYALALMAALLPALMGLLLLGSAVLITLKTDQQYLHTCRTEGLRGQKLVAPQLKVLMSLNPISVALRTKKHLAVGKMTVALASQNYIALAKATADYNTALENLRKLDAQQKQLIQQSNLFLRIAHQTTQIKLQKDGLTNRHLGILESTLSVEPHSPPKLAIHPNDADIAPTYSLEQDFENRQALVQKWHYTLEVVRPLRRLLSGTFQFEKSCAITLKEENHEWQPKMKKDKSS